jgi:cell division protein FtsB
MITFQEKRIRWQKMGFPFLVMAILLYLLFHALNGDHGVYALFMEQRRAEQLKEEYASLTQQREAMENRVHHLSDRSLDVDLLDERARQVLGYSAPDEKIQLVNEK